MIYLRHSILVVSDDDRNSLGLLTLPSLTNRGCRLGGEQCAAVNTKLSEISVP